MGWICVILQTQLSGTSPNRPLPERIAWTVVPPLIRGVGRIVWRLEFDHGEGFPEPPFVVASNHYSFFDPFLIAAALDRKIKFLALVDLFGNYAFVDFALRTFDVIPVRRGTVPLGPMRSALDHLSAGGVVGLFPEGTRHYKFDPGRARPGAAWLAARIDVPLVPIAVSGTDEVLGVDNRLHTGRIRVAVGPALHASGTDRAAIDDVTSRWGLWVSDRLKLTQEH
jgi:1-acyl-sn-glycerol-3-phosphate acyltransferase